MEVQENKKEEIIKKMLECDICKQFLAVCMKNPLRCPGLSYNEDGKAVVSRTGKLWEVVEKEHEAECKEEKDLFIEKHKKHLISHGIIKG